MHRCFRLNLHICCTEYARRIFYSFDVAYARSIATIFWIRYYFLSPSMPPMRYYVCLVCRRCGIISLMSLVVCSMHVCCRCSIHFANFTCSMLDARTRNRMHVRRGCGISLVNVSRSLLCATTFHQQLKTKHQQTKSSRHFMQPIAWGCPELGLNPKNDVCRKCRFSVWF